MQRGAPIIQELDQLDGEAQVVYRTLVLPGWLGPKHGMPDTLYGYIEKARGQVSILLD